MRTFERKVADLLRGYGEGLEMTTQDINRLEEELEQKRAGQRAAHKQRRNRIFQAAVAACAVTGVVLGALALRDRPAPEPSGPPPPVTTTQLEGIWRVDDGSGWLWRFTSDGKLIQSRKPSLLTDPVPVDAPAVRPAPGGFVVQGPTDDPKCVGTWTASISAEGRLVAQEPAETAACPGDNKVVDPPGDPWRLTRVSPVSVAGSTATSAFNAIEPTAVTLENQDLYLAGTWLLRGTGTVLTVSPNPQDAQTFAYAVQDLGGSADGPETGTMRARLNGEVIFMPRWPTDPCTLDYESVVTRGNSLEAKRRPGTCGRVGTGNDTWIRLN